MTNAPAGKAASRVRKPRVRLSVGDHERLSRLVQASEDSMPDVADALAGELDRAQILKSGASLEGIVRMGGTVEYRDDSTGAVKTISLVYPEEADIAEGRVSILTPIGAALIGLAAGDSMDWRTRTGSTKRLTILSVGDGAAA